MNDVKLCDSFQLSVTPVTSKTGENVYQIELVRDNQVIKTQELAESEYKRFMESLEPKNTQAAA